MIRLHASSILHLLVFVDLLKTKIASHFSAATPTNVIVDDSFRYTDGIKRCKIIKPLATNRLQLLKSLYPIKQSKCQGILLRQGLLLAWLKMAFIDFLWVSIIAQHKYVG